MPPTQATNKQTPDPHPFPIVTPGCWCGEWKLDEILAYAEVLERDLKYAHEASLLPEKNDFDKVNELLTNIIQEYHFDACENCGHLITT